MPIRTRPTERQVWQSRTQPARTITITIVGPHWTRYVEDQERAHDGGPKSGTIQTSRLAEQFRLVES